MKKLEEEGRLRKKPPGEDDFKKKRRSEGEGNKKR